MDVGLLEEKERKRTARLGEALVGFVLSPSTRACVSPCTADFFNQNTF